MLNSEIIKPSALVLTLLTMVPETLASPVVMVLSPPVFLLALLPPVSLVWSRLLTMSASLFWVVLSVFLTDTEPELVEPEPLSVFLTATLPALGLVEVLALLFPVLVIAPVEVASPVSIVVSVPV